MVASAWHLLVDCRLELVDFGKHKPHLLKVIWLNCINLSDVIKINYCTYTKKGEFQAMLMLS